MTFSFCVVLKDIISINGFVCTGHARCGEGLDGIRIIMNKTTSPNLSYFLLYLSFFSYLLFPIESSVPIVLTDMHN